MPKGTVVARTDPIVCAPRALSPHLCRASIPIACACLSCAPAMANFVATQKSSIMIRILPHPGQLCRNLKFPIAATWEPQALSKSIKTENSLSQKNSPVALITLSCAHPGLSCAWPGLSHAHGLLSVVTSSVTT